MIRRTILAIIALIMIITGSTMLAYGQKIDIDINIKDNGINVVEKHIIDVPESDIISFWIQKGHSDVFITINGSVVNPSSDNEIYYINISDLDITSETIIQVFYNLEKDTDIFEKNLQYDTDLIAISFNENELYYATNLTAGSSINLSLQKVSGQTIENIPIWIYIIIIVLVVLLVILLISLTKKQKSTNKKVNIGGSEELFAIKKSLLMETLKEIEKKHRNKQISDDTYHKLKDEFKQDAVEAMKHLEDLKK